MPKHSAPKPTAGTEPVAPGSPATSASESALVAIQVFAPDQYNDVGNGDYTLTVGIYAAGLSRIDGTPAQSTDVLSVQENGSLQTRPQGTDGNFERCRKTSAGAVYRPVGPAGRTVLIGVATDAPNS